jgi:methyl-accepting chemotaxis protein/methyl-accepting chemotaxis protein-1 (serine sensor receptor)
MEQMAAMTRRNADNSQQAAHVMAEVDAIVAQSNAALTSMVSSMTAIEDSSHRVGKIIKTIDEIAFQTKILALNAAVEAARAGEAGMGFAVVADEVRNLAQRSAQAAKDTASLVEASLETSGDGARNVALVAQSIQAITAGVTRVKGLVEEVSTASHEQSQGILQVSHAVARMERVTHSTAATAEENAAASEELSAQAEVAMSIVHQLQTMVGVGRRASDARRRGRETQRTVPASVPNISVFTNRADKPENVGSERQHPRGTGTFGSF